MSRVLFLLLGFGLGAAGAALAQGGLMPVMLQPGQRLLVTCTTSPTPGQSGPTSLMVSPVARAGGSAGEVACVHRR